MLAPTRHVQTTNLLQTLSDFSAANLNLAAVGADPIDAVYEVLTRYLPWAYGTTDSRDFQTFEYKGLDVLSHEILTAEVLGLSVGMNCQPAKVENIMQPTLASNISSPDCQINDIVLAQGSEFERIPGIVTLNYQGSCNYHLCNVGGASSTNDCRILLAMSKVTWVWGWDVQSESSVPTNFTIAQSTAALCKPSYSVDKYKVTLIPSNQTLWSAELIYKHFDHIARIRFERPPSWHAKRFIGFSFWARWR
jgi:hypothetical protein